MLAEDLKPIKIEPKELVSSPVRDIVKPVENTNMKEHFQISFSNTGRNQNAESAEEIWENILEDCETTEEKHLIKDIVALNRNNIAKPVYGESAKIVETGEEINIDLVWKQQRIMLFLDANYESYKKAQKIGWNCYCTTHGFDIEELLEQVKG
jgi:hypothetical protein